MGIYEIDRVLVLAPHTDDAELGCGGTIAKFIDQGIDIYVAVFSTAKESLPPNSPADTLKKEFLNGMAILGVQPARISVFDYPVRRLNDHRQDILENLVSLGRSISPGMVLSPSGADVHQDHQVLFAEAVRAFKRITLWGYELPWNHIVFAAQAFVTLEAKHVEKKWEALRAYQSQLELNRRYFSNEYIEALARVRGAQIGVEFSEAFDVTRFRW